MLAALCAALCLVFVQTTQAIQAEPSNGVPGVENNTCWKNTVGNKIHVKVRGVMDHMEVTVTEGENSGRGIGGEDPDGGCSESEEITVGDEKYRVHNGKMQHKNDSDQWINMSKTKCPKDDEER